MNQVKERAEKMREQGYSYSLIRKELGVAKSTLSYWFKDKPFTPNPEVTKRIQRGPVKSGILRHNKKVSEIAIMRVQGIKELGELSKRDLWMLGLGLYIGEGSKTIETVGFANADPKVIVVIVRWLKETCRLTTDNITARLHLYPDCDLAAAHRYWQDITGLPAANFRKPYIDTRLNKKRTSYRKLPFGTIDLRVVANGDKERGARLFRRLNGWMAGALDQV